MSEALEIPKYPHIERLTAESPLFLLREVLATEKLDGTNARFGLVGGQFQIGGRNIIFGAEDDPFGFRSWCEANDIEARVRAANPDGEDVSYHGEWFGPRIQKGIDYGAERRFLGFDVWRRDGSWLDHEAMVDAFGGIGLYTAPVVHRGPIDSMSGVEWLKAQCTSVGVIKDGNLWEGTVVRPPVTLRDRRGNLLIAKLKNPAFDEKRPPKEPRPGPDGADVEAVLAYCTEERLRHVLTGLREAGVDTSSTRSTGDVIRAYVADVIREATDLTESQRSTIGKVVPGEARRLYFAHLEGAA